MGVRGLNTFIDKNENVTKSYELHDTKVIVDGCNLAHFLYSLDYLYGGEYGEYSDKIKEYFSSYAHCNIEPIVVFDGGLDKSDRMFEKLLEREESRLEKVKKLVNCTEVGDYLLPINAYDTFKTILLELNIKFVQCDYEGDNQMASLANQYGCPLISNDSDFYILDLPQGFIRLSSMDMVVRTRRTRSRALIKYLACSLYTIDSLMLHFPLRDPNVLPLLAILAGNDYVSYDDFKQFFYRVKVNQHNPKKKFVGLLQWLQDFTLNQAIKQVIHFTENHKKNEIKWLIESSLEDYRLKPTNLAKLLEIRNLTPSNKIMRNTEITTCCGAKLPPQFVIAFHQGFIQTSFLNIITLHRMYLLPQVEKFSNVSSYSCSLYIRQITYGILLQHDSSNESVHNKKCFKKIDEYDRVNEHVKQVRVPFLTQLRNGKPVLRLPDIYSMRKTDLRIFIADLLNVPTNFFLNIPNYLQLFFGCVVYFLCNSSPKPVQEFLDAIILSVIYYCNKKIVLEENIVSQMENKMAISHFRKDNTSKNYSSFYIYENLSKFLQKPPLTVPNSLDLNIIHSYSQLQACIQDITSLNSLFNFPFEFPPIHDILSGILLYNLTSELLRSKNVNVFISQLINNDPENVSTFNMYKSKFIDNIPKNYLYSHSQKRYGGYRR